MPLRREVGIAVLAVGMALGYAVRPSAQATFSSQPELPFYDLCDVISFNGHPQQAEAKALREEIKQTPAYRKAFATSVKADRALMSRGLGDAALLAWISASNAMDKAINHDEDQSE